MIAIQATFSENVTSTNSSLSLNNGATASYTLGTNTVHTYTYTVGGAGSGERISDLSVASFNVGDAKDGSLNAVDPSLPTGQNLGDNRDIIIDVVAATITNIDSTTIDGAYTTGEVIAIQVTFSENVTSTTSSLTLNNGGSASYTSGSNTV